MGIIVLVLLTTAVFVTLKGARVLGTLFAVALGAGPLETGIVFAMFGLFPFVLSVWAGRIADRLDNRTLIYCGIGGVAACLLLPFAVPTLPALYVAVAFGGLSSMLFVVATQNLMGVLSTAENRARNFSYYSLGESLATVIGPVFVGLAIDAFRHPLTYLCLAIYTAALGLLFYINRHRVPDVVRSAPSGERRSSLELLKLPALRNAMITNGIVMAGLDLFSLYMPVYAHGLGLSASAIGFIVGAFGAAGIVTRLAIPWLTRAFGERRTLAWTLGLSALTFVTFPFTTSPVLLGCAAFVLGLGLGCGQPLTMLLAYNASPPGRSAEGISMRLAVSYGSHVVLPPVFGAFGSVFGLAPVFWTGAMLLAGGALLSRPRRRETGA